MRPTYTIMIVDDDRLVREAYHDLFQAEGFAVVEATNGADALLWLHGGPADLIILDLEMPIMDGRSFLEYRLVHPDIREIPVLVVSSRTDGDGSRQSPSKLGADRVLQKPVRLKDLLGVVRETLAATARTSDRSPSADAAQAAGRRDARLVFSIPIRIRSRHSTETSGKLRDLSAGGLGAYLLQQLGQGETITVSLDIEGRSLTLTGFVQWAGDSATTMGYPHGVRFTKRQDGSFPLYTYSFFAEHLESSRQAPPKYTH
jgi:CheY-like chemotaxis protein